jgi:anti-sigma regulatory factor (Ser/Thr protein kinase)
VQPTGDELPRSTALALELPAVPASAGLARGALKDVLQRGADGQARETAALLVTELVTNAARHVGGMLRLEVAVEKETLRVEVRDGSPFLPAGPALPEWASESGRGLFLIDALADRWGADVLPDGKRVWFELAVQHREAS